MSVTIIEFLKDVTILILRFGRELAKSRSSHFLKASNAGEDSDSGLPSSSAALTSDDDNLSSWARYLKNKYGSKTKKSSSSKEEQQRNEINSKQQHNTVNYLLLKDGGHILKLFPAKN